MPIDKKTLEDFEKKYKDAIFNKISEVRSKQFEEISQMITNATDLGQSNVRIPNASITLNNKLVELSQLFKKSGISMFSATKPEHLSRGDFYGRSIIGDAIIHDLIDKLTEAIGKLGEYGKTMGDVSKKRNERLLALQNISPIRKLFLRIGAFFVPVQPIDLSLTEEEQDALDSSLQEYTDIDSEIWNYNLKDNIVQTLVKEIAGPGKIGNFDIKHRYDAYTVPGLLEESVIPDLKKLGLEHLIPQLQEALIEEYKKDLSDPEIYQVEHNDMYLYVPDFSRKPEKPHELTEKLRDMHQKEDESHGEFGLKDFKKINLGVPASDRQDAAGAINHGGANKDIDKTNKEDEILR